MKNSLISGLLALLLILSVAGCVYYFKVQLTRYSIKTDSIASIKLEKEQTFRIPRAKPLKMFRPPKVIPGFIVFTTTALNVSGKLRDKNTEIKAVPTPVSLSESLKKVEQIEELVKKYIKDGYTLSEIKAYGYVSTTLTARLIACYNALTTLEKRTIESDHLRDIIKNILIENSEVALFEIMTTFEDTLSAFPDVAINSLELVQNLDLTPQQRVDYYARFLNHPISERTSNQDLARERSLYLALEKLNKQELTEIQIKIVVENFIEKNNADPRKRRQAVSISKQFFPGYFDSKYSE